MSQPAPMSSALKVLSDAEKAAILDELAAADPDVEGRAERAARSRLAEVEADDVASGVTAALLALDQDDLAAHAGRTRYGYVEPTEAAWSLLEAAFEPWLEDIARRAGLGLAEAARQLAFGSFEALRRLDRHIRNDDRLISWAPDFCSETADRILQLLSDLGIELADTEPAHAFDRA